MSALSIARMGAEVLRQPAAEVVDLADPGLWDLVDDMIETMFEAGGVGLAAPQVYHARRVVIFFVPAARNQGIEVPLTVMVNPVINPLDDVTEESLEACLSVPGLTGMVPRFANIRYHYQDMAGALIEREAHGFHARVVQHECDHLDGVVYPMRMDDLSTLAFSDVLLAEASARGHELELDEEG
ncbi:MAG: peptide deformylase [Rhodospirillaceae bacterium]|nr:peptide deformylase [Rhodospirillaceae bacterium]